MASSGRHSRNRWEQIAAPASGKSKGKAAALYTLSAISRAIKKFKQPRPESGDAALLRAEIAPILEALAYFAEQSEHGVHSVVEDYREDAFREMASGTELAGNPRFQSGYARDATAQLYAAMGRGDA